MALRWACIRQRSSSRRAPAQLLRRLEQQADPLLRLAQQARARRQCLANATSEHFLGSVNQAHLSHAARRRDLMAPL
jgi:hypothetical protein